MRKRVWATAVSAALWFMLRSGSAHACLEPLLLSDNNNYINNTDICTLPTTQPGSNNGISDYVSGGSRCNGVTPSALCRDYWKFVLSDWANLTVDMDTLGSDVDLHLYNGDLNEIASSANSGTTAEQLTASGLTPGTYYVLVNMYGTADSNYRVWATVTKLCDEAATSGDLNNAYNESKVCHLPTTGTYAGNINASVDTADWWSAATSSTGKFTVRLTGLSANVDLDLYDSGPSTLLDSSAGTGSTDEWVDGGSTALSARTYYVRARAIGSASTTYTLKTFYCSEPDSSANDRNNGPFGSSICPLPTTGGVQSGAFNSSTDKEDDFWKMVLGSSGSVSVKVDLTGLSVDCDLYVYDETFQTQLGSSINTGTANESITVSLSPGTYAIWVNDYANGTTTYSLSAQIQGDSTPPGAPTSPSWSDGSTSSDLNITATWTAPTDPSGIADYRLQVCEYPSPATPNFGTCTLRYNGLIGSSATSTTLTSGQNGIALDKFYYLHVAAKDGAGNEGSYSSASGYVNTVDTAPPDFMGLEAASDPGKGGFVDLQWAAANDASPPITYNIYYSTTSGGQNYSSPTFSTTNTSYRASGLTNGTTYYFVVRAKDNLAQEDTNTVEKSAAPSANFISCYSPTNQPPHDFESNNGGWTPSSANVAWGTPTGSGGSAAGNPDPPSGYGATSGNGKVWGNNLSGDYPNNQTINLTSVAFNCANRSNIKIRYRRWLNHEGNGYDIARIQACAGGGCSFTDVWTAGATAGSGSVRDAAWFLHEVAPSPANAWDGQTSLQIRFNLTTDNAVALSGWNIDEFDIGGVSTDTTPPTFAGATSAVTTCGSGCVTVSWAAGSDASEPVTYNIYRGSTGFTPGPSNAVPPGGFTGTSYTDTGLTAGTQYCFVARARDAMGNQDTNTVERCATPTTTAPNAPTSPSQADGNDTPIAQGGSITSNTVKFTATMTDPDSDTVKLQVEVKAVGIAFTGVPTVSATTYVASGSSQTVSLSLSNGSYHWQARTMDSLGSSSVAWTAYGANTDPNDTDFTTNGSAPDLILATATDTAGTPTAGLSAGDRVILEFSSATNQATCPGVLTYLLLSSSHGWGSGPSCSWDTNQKLTITPGSGATVAAGDTITIQNAGCGSSICDSGNSNVALGSPPGISGTFDAGVRSLSVIRGTLQAFGANIWTQCTQAQSDYDSDLAGTAGDTFLGTFVLSREGAAGSGDSIYVVNSAGTDLRASAAVDTLCGGACGDGVGTVWAYTQNWGANTCAGTEKEWIWFGTTTGKMVGATFTGSAIGIETGYTGGYTGGGTACKGSAVTFNKITTGVQGDNEMIYFGAQTGAAVDYVCSVCWNNNASNTYCNTTNCTGSTAPYIYKCVDVDANPPTEDSTAMQYNASATNLRVYVAGTGARGVTEFQATTAADGLLTPDTAPATLTKNIGGGYAVYGLPWMHITQGRFYVPTASGSAGALRVFNKSDFTDYTNFTGGYTGGGGVGPSKALQPWLAHGGIFFGDDTGKLHCVVESTGAACTGFPVQPDGTNPIRSQPVVYKGVLYFSNTVGKVFAYDITTNCCTLKSPVQLTSNGYPFNLGVSLAGSLVPDLNYTYLVLGGVGGNVWYLPMWIVDPTP
ncbi:MAG: pre-peptidase C-terminal domain-containing protein [Nitrospirae bacterium]|nr:pre-peptidase C-terminal domain-containing protein [Nitrospirota bacterium]